MKMESLSDFSGKIFSNRKALLFLIFANLAGFAAGIYFYWNQLMDSSPVLWILILDSPISVLLFAIVCALFYFRKRIPEALKFLTTAYVIKYGIWTLLTLWLYWSNYVIFEDRVIGILDFILHFAMIIEGMVLIPKIRPKIRDAIAVLLVLLTNDVADYFFGTVTRVPPTYMNVLMAESFFASIFIIFAIFISQNRKP